MVKIIVNLWKKYREDSGLGALGLMFFAYNTLFFFLSGFAFGFYNFYCLLPIGIYSLFILIQKKWKVQHRIWNLILSIIPLFFSIGINYLLVGEIDIKAGKLLRWDEDLVIFDRWLYGTQAALFIEQFNFGWSELYRKIFYDYLVLSYISYYFLPFYGGVLYYKVLLPNEKYKIVPFFSTIMVYYGVNFLFYLFIPVTGPQYYLKELFVGDIPMSAVGQFFYALVRDGQHTKIDCFPSGHTGIGVLVSFWLFKIKHPQVKLCLFITLSIMLATLGLRYHYTLDLLAAFPVAILSFYGGIWFFPEKIAQYGPVEEGSERHVDPGTNTD